MAGGEFRLGPDSIYMADDEHIRRKGTSPKFWITWLRFQRKYATLGSFQLVVRIARRKLGLDPYVSLSAHTAPDVRPPAYSGRQWAKRVGSARITRANHSLAPAVRARSRLYL